MRIRSWSTVVVLIAVACVATLSSRGHVHTAECSEGVCLLAAAPVRAAPAPQAAKADIIFISGIVYTGEPTKPRVEAVAVSGEKIIATGSTKEIMAHVGPATRTVDLRGRFAMPGFNDAHIHLASGGAAKLAVDFTGAKSLKEFQQRIRARLAEYKAGEWITGRGWDHTLWPEKRFPTRAELDSISAEHPMIFTRVDGHVAVANSLALERAQISEKTSNPPGGEIERDKNGRPTGMLKENAMALVRRKVPDLTPAQRRRGIELAMAEAARFGLTSIQDNSGWSDFQVYEQLKKEGKLTVRISEWLPFTAPMAQLEEWRRRGGTTGPNSDPWLKTSALKGVVDGTLGSRTAAMLAPFADDASTRGILRLEAERLKQMAIERDKAGFQIALHSIGDQANRVSLDSIAAARSANGKRDARHRIEHAQVVALEDIPRFNELEVIASMQPCHELTDSRWAGARLGPERSKGAYAWNSMLMNKVRMAFGTDYAVEPLTPFRGLYACVTRETPDNERVPGDPTGSWIPEEKISLDACIREYTVGSAYAEFEESRKGRIAPGQLADIIVLSADVTQIPPRQILSTEVLMTFVGGRLVYEKK